MASWTGHPSPYQCQALSGITDSLQNETVSSETGLVWPIIHHTNVDFFSRI